MKNNWWRTPAVVLMTIVTIIAGIFSGCDETVQGEYTYESSRRWYETMESIVLDAKKDDGAWQNITPFERSTKPENRAEKYEALESRITECNARVYTYFGEKGLFLFAETDDPVVNTGVVSPLAKSAFEFYICSQDALTKWGNIFEFTISADNCLKLRVRDHHPETGAEAWVNRPCTGVKSATSIQKAGYSVECFIPWTTLNIPQKPAKLQLATALIRVLDKTDSTNYLWECFDYYSAPIALNNSATFPLFDEGGYIPLRDGDNFKAVSSNIIDLSTDTGDTPYVTTLNRNVVTSFLKMDAAVDVYWESTVTICDFNPNDDPRVGIVLKGEEREDGFYDRVYLMLELEKAYEGEGYQLKHALLLPSSSSGNNWTDAQRYVLASHIENESFKLAAMKHNGIFYFFIDDVLVASRSVVEDFAADTKVTCGITSWYTGAIFSDYMATTESLDTVLGEKSSTFVTDEKKWKLYFDLFHQSEGYVTTEESDAWMYHSIANFQGVNASRFYAETDIRIDGSLVNGNGYAGFVLTSGENRLYIMLGGTQKGLKYVEYHSMTKDNFKPDGADHKVCEAWDTVKLGNKNKLAIYRDGNHLTVLLNGEVMEQIDLTALTYPIQGSAKVGLTGWKVKARFSGYRIKSGSTFQTPEFSKASSGVTHGDFTMELTQEPTADIFAETTLRVCDVMEGVYPRVGLRLTNQDGENLDFFAYYNQEKTAQNWVMARPTDAESKDIDTAQYYGIDSAVDSLSGDGIKLAVAKKDGVLYFYVNDVLLGAKTYDGFASEDKVTASLYSKYTETDFSDYTARTDVAAAVADKMDAFIADGNRSSDCFDVLRYADSQAPKITIHETCAYKESSIIHWNGVCSDRIYAQTSVALNNTDNTYAGIVLTDEKGNRFYIMTYGNVKGITYMEYFTVLGDDFESRSSVYDKISVAGGNQCSVSIYKDGGSLLVYVDDVQVKTIALPEALAGQTKVGLAAWKGTSAVYTDYSVLAGEDYPELQEPEIVGDASDVNNSGHIFYLNETPYHNVKAYTTVSVKDVLNGVSPRVGLRLISTSGKTLDVVVAYKNTQQLWEDWLLLVPSDETGEGTYQWVELPAGTLTANADISLKVEKVGDTLSIYIGDALVHSGNYEGFTTQDAVTAALYSRYTETVFTDYKAEELIPPAEDSGLNNSNHVFALNGTAAAELYAQTFIKVADVLSGVSPRAGLRMTNEAGCHVDFFVYFNTSKAVQNWVIAVPVDGNNADAGTKQYYGIDSAVDSICGDGIKLAVAKKDDSLYFYVNDVLLGAKTYDGFAAEDKVSASLYSKYTETDFFDYSVTTDINTALDEKLDDFVADGNRTSDCFDVLNYADEENPQIVINETCSNAQCSIIHWNEVYSDSIYAQTSIALNNTGNAYAGMVLSDEENNRFYVMTYGNADGITYMEYFTVMGDDYNGRHSVYDKITVAGGNQCKLAICKVAGDLIVYVDDAPVKTITLPEKLAGKTKVGLSAWKSAKAVFTDYKIMDAYVTDVTKSTDLYVLRDEAAGDFYAETLLRINAPTTGVYSRLGLRLSSAEKTWDCVAYFSNRGVLQPYILLVDQAENKQYTQDFSAILPDQQMPLTLRLGVKRKGGKLSIYLNGVLLKDYYVPDSTEFSCFGAEDAISVSLYSKLTDAAFMDYSFEEIS